MLTKHITFSLQWVDKWWLLNWKSLSHCRIIVILQTTNRNEFKVKSLQNKSYKCRSRKTELRIKRLNKHHIKDTRWNETRFENNFKKHNHRVEILFLSLTFFIFATMCDGSQQIGVPGWNHDEQSRDTRELFLRTITLQNTL